MDASWTRRWVLGVMASSSLVGLGCGGGGGDCSDDFPTAPAGAKDTLFVSDKCGASGAAGTESAPLASIGEALKKAKAGATILVAAGTYAENLVVDHDVAIVGPASKGKKGDDAGIILQAPQPDAIVVDAGVKGTFVGFSVEDAKGVGFFAKGGDVTVAQSKISGTKTANGTAYGVAANTNGAIILQDSAIVGSEIVGVFVNGAHASFAESDISKNAMGGIHLEVANDDVTVDGCTFTDNGGYAVASLSSGLIILQSQIHGTKGTAGNLGDGIVVGFLQGETTPASIRAEHNTIAENDQVGILIAGGAHGIILQDNHVDDNALGTGFGAGIWLQGGNGGDAANVLRDNHLTGNRFIGIGMVGDTGGIEVATNHVIDTKLGSFMDTGGSHQIGDGFSLFSGASGNVHDNEFVGSGRFGVVLDGEAGGNATTIQGNTIAGSDRYGIILQNQGAAPNIGPNTFMNNKAGNRDDVPDGSQVDVVDGAFSTP